MRSARPGTWLALAPLMAGGAVTACGGTVAGVDDRTHVDGAGGASGGSGGASSGAGAGGGAGGGSGGLVGSGGTSDATASADWTMLGFDLASSYFNAAERKVSVESARRLEPAWQLAIGVASGDGNVTGAVAIAGGVAYLGGRGVRAVTLASGDIRWENPDLSVYASLAYDAGVVYVHDATGTLHALSAADGVERWSVVTDDHPNLVGFSSPIVTPDFVLVGGSTLEEVSAEQASFRGFVVAVNKVRGSVAWKRYTVDPGAFGATVWSSVSVDPVAGVVFAATGNNHGPPATDTSDAFLAMPLADGARLLWKNQILGGDIWMQQGPGVTSPEFDFGANPVLLEAGGKRLVAGGNKGGDYWVLDRVTGEVVSRRNLGPGSSFKGGIFTAGAWDGRHLLTVCNAPSAATLFALDPVTLDVAWQREVQGPVFGPITVANGVGFFGANQTLQAFDTATGEVLFEYPTEATIASAPVVSDGHVVFGSGMSWISATAGSTYHALRVP